MNFIRTGHPRWKWSIDRDYVHELGFLVEQRLETEWVDLFPRRLLVIAGRYFFDGVTGFFDFKCLLRAALVHDALCQMIAAGHLPGSFRRAADQEFRRICREDGCPVWLAATLYNALRAYAWIKQRRELHA